MTVDFPKRLALAFAVVKVVAAGIAAVALVSLYSSSQTTQRLIEKEAAELVAVERLRGLMDDQALAMRGYLLSGDARLLDDRAAAERTVSEELERLRKTATSESIEHLDRIERLAAEHQGVVAPLAKARLPAQLPSEPDAFAAKVLPSYRTLDDALRSYADHQHRVYAAASAAAARQTRTNLIAIAAVMGFGLLLSTSLAVGLGRGLSRSYQSESEARRVAQAAVAARQDLLGSVAHDLRNPLAAITLKAHLIATALPAGSRAAEHATSLQRVAGRMKFLIGSLLDAASLEAGALTLRTSSIRMRDLLAGAVEMFEAQAAQRQVSLTASISEDDLELRGDPERLLQVLSNLVGNAVKYTPAGGAVRLSCEPALAGARVVVADTGPGIRPDDLPRVFDRYWKRDHEASNHGTGLGLYIAREIVERHGGRIGVESRLGKGASFWFEIPRSLPDAPARGSEAAAPTGAL